MSYGPETYSGPAGPSATPTAAPSPAAYPGDGGRQVRWAPEPTTAELVQQASEQISRLVRDELALARAEVASSARHAGAGAGLLGGGAVLALYGIGALVLAAILGLAVVLPGWLAALIVGGGLLVLAAMIGLSGGVQLRNAMPPVSQRVMSSVRADLDTVTNAVRSRGRP
jgi:hypothetical protein